MSQDIQCPDCGCRFTQDEPYIEHLIKQHPRRVQTYLINKSPVIVCPGGCGSLYDATDLGPSTVCQKDGYEIGNNRFKWAATFVAANDADRQKGVTTS